MARTVVSWIYWINHLSHSIIDFRTTIDDARILSVEFSQEKDEKPISNTHNYSGETAESKVNNCASKNSIGPLKKIYFSKILKPIIKL